MSQVAELLKRVVRVERHGLGPRVYLLGFRAHDYHLGLAILLVLAVGALAGRVGLSLPAVVAALAGLFLLIKDWRDLFPRTRDTRSWSLGLHRPHLPLRSVRLFDSLPLLAAVSVAAIAALNLVSALTPNAGWRGHLLRQLGPVKAVAIFHALAVPAAALLFLCAFYLLRRRRHAWRIALLLAIGLGVLDIVKGLDLEEAGASFAAAALLWWGRNAFYVRHEPITLRSAVARVPLLVIGALVVAVSAVWIAAPPRPSLRAILSEAGNLLLWRSPSFSYHDDVGRLPLAIELLSVVTAAVCLYIIFRPLAAPRNLPDAPLRRAAAALVRRYGSDTLAFFKLRGDKHYLFTADRRAFLGYRVESGVLLVSGDPVGPPEAVRELIREAVAFAERRGLKLAAVGASASAQALWQQAGLRSLYLGDEAVVETARFSLEGRAIRKVRQSVTRLQTAGYTVTLERFAALDEETRCRLEAIFKAWRQGAPERGFSMAMDALRGEHESETSVLLARDREQVVRGFLYFVPSFGREAVSLSFMRREHETPNGLTEFMVVRAIELLREHGVEEISLNFAAFARWLHSPESRLERLLGRLIAFANPFFQIESLYRFNAKFFPHWEPRYFLYEGVLGLPRAALATLFIEGQLPKPSPRALAGRLRASRGRSHKLGDRG